MLLKLLSIFLALPIAAAETSIYAISQYSAINLDNSWNIAPDAVARKLDESFKSQQRKFKNLDTSFFGKLKYPLRAMKSHKNGTLLIEISTAPPELSQKEVLGFDSLKLLFVDKYLRERIAAGMEQVGFSNVRTNHLRTFDSKYRFVGFDIQANNSANEPISSTKYWLYTSNETIIFSFTAAGKDLIFPKSEISKILAGIAELI